MQGRSLLELMSSREDGTDKKDSSSSRLAYFETFYPFRQFGWSELRGIRTEKHKYIEAPRAELYDVATDPGEKQNLYRQQQAMAGSMKGMLNRHLANYASPPPSRRLRRQGKHRKRRRVWNPSQIGTAFLISSKPYDWSAPTGVMTDLEMPGE
jgi:hypothetical protein